MSTAAKRETPSPPQPTRPRHIPAGPRVSYAVPRSRESWELSEETIPESAFHDAIVDLLRLLLVAWLRRSGRRAQVVRNLAVRWEEQRPGVGVDPDVALLEPPPPEGEDIRSLRTWVPGHQAPVLAIEVVSETNPRKDYSLAPDKYAASGTRELVIFDPLLAGPSTTGGPFRVQLWVRDDAGSLMRVHAGDLPVRSPTLDAWLVLTDDGRRLRIADDAEGDRLWLTGEESERVESARLAAERDAALARVAALEAELRRRATE